MSYNIEFQISGLIFISILGIVFFSKPRWKCLQNTIFRVLLIVTFIELLFDIISVITISHMEKIPLLNAFFARGYLVCLVLWVATCVIYIISNTIYDNISSGGYKRRIVVMNVIGVSAIIAIFCVLLTPLSYFHKGRCVYTYGTATVCAYVFFVYCVLIALCCFFASYKYIPWKRRIPVLFFTIMDCIVALSQNRFPELLIIGFFTAVCVFIMHMTLEDPDMDMIDKLDAANKRANELLLNVLPNSIATKLSNQAAVQPITEYYENVTIAFMDIVGFTNMSAKVGPESLVRLLNSLFSEIDVLLDKYRIEKIKTIGDAYMVASGVPEKYPQHTKEMILFLQEVLAYMDVFNERNKSSLQIRIGVHCGPVVAGVIGKKKFIYDLWGASVNFASRMESHGLSNRIQVSESVYNALCQDPDFTFELRENLKIKGVGESNAYVIC